MFYPYAFFLTTVMGGAAGVKAMCLAIYSAKKEEIFEEKKFDKKLDWDLSLASV